MNMKLCLIVLLLLLFPVTVRADIAPKERVDLFFENMPDESFYVTLLSSEVSSGPYTVFSEEDSDSRYREGDKDYDIWKAFVSYEDRDEFHFLQYFEKGSDTGHFEWFSRCPYTFKVLLYFPESGSYAVSEQIYTQYAFDSNFTVDLSGVDGMEDVMLDAGRIQKSNDYTGEWASAAARMGATVILELLAGLLFGYWTKRDIRLIVLVNVLTQVLLNILLVFVSIHRGPYAFVFHYIWTELLVLVIEAFIYQKWLGPAAEAAEKKSRKPIAYAVVANLFSFGMGLVLMRLLPGVF